MVKIRLFVTAFLFVLCWCEPSVRAQRMFVTSPEVTLNGNVTFRLRAPNAKSVLLRGQWAQKPIPLSLEVEDTWSLTLPDVPSGIWEYQFIVDGLAILDPTNPAIKPQRQPNTSILHLPSQPAKPWDFQNLPHGTVHQHSQKSASLAMLRDLWVYTPPGYEAEPTKRYPLLVLQHGSGDRHDTWVVHGKAHWILDHLIAAGKAVPMIVMMIDGHPLGMVPRDQAARRAESLKAFQTELLHEALPFVEKHYRIQPGAEKHAIAGLSMGGWQSVSVGMNHLDVFSSIASFSGAIDVTEIQPALSQPEITRQKLRLLWVACGKEDFLLDRNHELITKLKAKNIQHEWLMTEGGHSWPIWRQYFVDLAPRLFR